MLEDMCTKTCSGPIISQSTKWMTGLRFYPTSDTEHYQLMRLYDFFVNRTNYGMCICVLCALEVLRQTYYVM